MKKIIRYIRNIFIGIISLIIIFIVFSQTGIFRDILRDILTSELNKSVFNGELLIGEINGNLFSNIEIDDIKLLQNDSAVIKIKKLAVKFDVLSLLSSKIEVKSLLLDAIDFNLIQLKDSSLNISSIFKSSDDTTSSSPFDWTIQVEDLIIKNSVLRTSFLDTTLIIPGETKNINIELHGLYSTEKTDIRLKRLNLQGLSPDLVLKDLQV